MILFELIINYWKLLLKLLKWEINWKWLVKRGGIKRDWLNTFSSYSKIWYRCISWAHVLGKKIQCLNSNTDNLLFLITRTIYPTNVFFYWKLVEYIELLLVLNFLEFPFRFKLSEGHFIFFEFSEKADKAVNRIKRFVCAIYRIRLPCIRTNPVFPNGW